MAKAAKSAPPKKRAVQPPPEVTRKMIEIFKRSFLGETEEFKRFREECRKIPGFSKPVSTTTYTSIGKWKDGTPKISIKLGMKNDKGKKIVVPYPFEIYHK